MHEFSIVENILNIIEDTARQNNLNQITKVTLQIGKMRQVVPDILEFAFNESKKHTVVADAILEQEYVPIKMKCKSCGEQFIVDDKCYICPHCRAPELDTITGNELIVKKIQGDQ
jgi:hydrogenase nickel incorporation protein HypA/HybF